MLILSTNTECSHWNGQKLFASHMYEIGVTVFAGPMYEIDVIDVARQEDHKMLMRNWTEYYNSPERHKILNVISLEFSKTGWVYLFKGLARQTVCWNGKMFWPQSDPKGAFHRDVKNMWYSCCVKCMECTCLVQIHPALVDTPILSFFSFHCFTHPLPILWLWSRLQKWIKTMQKCHTVKK